MKERPHFSIVSPVYKAENIIEKLVDEIQKTMSIIGLPFEIILVDDRSPDNCWKIMQKISSQNSNVKCIRLSRNFGQHSAIMAVLSNAQGEWIVVMDCDLQDQPKEIEKLFAKTKEGFDVVLASRQNRQDTFFKIISSKLFSIVYSYLTETKFDNTIANFGIYNSKVIAEVVKMNDYIKSFPLFVNWVGYTSTSIQVEHAERESGKSSYSVSKLLTLAFNTIVSFSNKPLKLFVKFGLLISIFSFIFGIYVIYRYIKGDITVLGYSSLVVSIWFLSGVIITIIGVVGIYVGKIFDQSKRRDSFIIDKKVNYDV